MSAEISLKLRQTRGEKEHQWKIFVTTGNKTCSRQVMNWIKLVQLMTIVIVYISANAGSSGPFT